MFNSSEFPASQAAQSVPTCRAFGVDSRHLSLLDAGLTRLETIELAARELEAERIAALAEIDLAARLEATSEFGPKSRMRAAEDSLAYRAARAETATAIHLSEQAAADHLMRAASLASVYQATVGVLKAGKISRQHAMVILDAGNVIGPVDLHGGAGADAGSLPRDTEFLAMVAANRALYEALVLVEAVKTTPNRLAPIARSIAERFALEDLDTRHERAKTQRRLWVRMFEDGMAEIVAVLPAHEATAVVSRLTEMAKQAQQTQDRTSRELRDTVADAAADADGETGTSTSTDADSDTGTDADSDTGTGTGTDSGSGSGADTAVAPTPLRRTRPEFMTDIFVDLLLNGTGATATGGPGSGTGISGVVQLITHEEHLSGPALLTKEVSSATGAAFGQLPYPELEGYGPIPIGMAQDIAATEGTWSQVNISLSTGNVLTVDRYRPTAEIRRFLAARDRRCRFPGCRVQVYRCDFDHTVDAAHGGPTSTQNLGALCRGHHLLKHHTGWATEQHANGDYEWTSPTGRTHIDEPISRVRFTPMLDEGPEPGSKPRSETGSEPKYKSESEPGLRPEGIAPSETDSLGDGREETHPF